MRTPRIGFLVESGVFICLIYGHFGLKSFKCITGIPPVSLFAMHAVTFKFNFRLTLSSSELTGFVSNVSICLLNTITVTFSVVPCNTSSAATSAFKYVLPCQTIHKLLATGHHFFLELLIQFGNLWNASWRYSVSSCGLLYVLLLLPLRCRSSSRISRSAGCSFWPASTRFGSVGSVRLSLALIFPPYDHFRVVACGKILSHFSTCLTVWASFTIMSIAQRTIT